MGMTRASLYKVLKVRDPTNLPKKGSLSDSGRFETTGVRGHCPPGFRDWSVASGSAVAVARSFDVPPRIRTNSAGRRIRIRRPNSIEPSVSCRHSALLHSTVPPAAGQLTAHITLTMPRHAHRKDGTAVYSDDEDEYIYRTNYIWKRRQVKVLWRCH